jgi:Caspase domain
MQFGRRKFISAAGASLALGPQGLFAHGPNSCYRALLIGVCDYVKFPSRNLEGPAHDIRRVRDFLQTRGCADITVVADRQERGVPLPTRQNIIAAFAAISKRIAANELLFLYFAGHGAQQPIINPKSDHEIDGLDEVLLPSDAGRLTENLTVKNAIVDDEIGRFITHCRNRGAFVWVVIDACHSGDSTRAVPLPAGSRERGLSSLELGFPEWLRKLIDRFPNSNKSMRLGQIDSCGAEEANLPGSLLAFFACKSSQRTIELPMPRGGSNAQYTGLFTHVLMNQLGRVSNSMAKEMTYFDLVRQIEQTYANEWQGWDWQPQFCADPLDAIAKRRIFT